MLTVCAVIVVMAVLLVFRREDRRACLFLSAFLISVVLELVPQIIGFAGAYDKWPGLSFYPFETELYFGPLIYLHARSLVSADKLGWRWGLLIPGAIQTLYYSSIVLIFPDYLDRWAYDANTHTPIISPIELVLALSLTIGAIVTVFKLLREYQTFLAATQSTDQFDPSWLRLMLPGIALVGGLAVLLLLLNLMYGHIGYTSEYPILLSAAIIIAWLGLVASRRLTTRFPKFSDFARPSQTSPKKVKNWNEEGSALKAAVEEGGWFLEPSFSLRDLSERLATNDTYASRAINDGLGMNFSSFINSLRTSHAKSLLTGTQKSVLAIALDSGFGSKATFNRVFKQLVGVTPTAYRTQNS